MGRVRLFNFVFLAFSASCYFQAKISSSTLGSLYLPCLCLGDSLGCPPLPSSGSDTTSSRKHTSLLSGRVGPSSWAFARDSDLLSLQQLQSLTDLTVPLPHHKLLQVRDCVILGCIPPTDLQKVKLNPSPPLLPCLSPPFLPSPVVADGQILP